MIVAALLLVTAILFRHQAFASKLKNNTNLENIAQKINKTLTLPPSPKFPDFSNNYVVTVVQPAQAAEAARQAQLAAEEAQRAQTALYVAQTGSDGYTAGQCTAYAASRHPVPSNWGNAVNWLYNAQANGYKTGSTPQVGAIAWTSAGYIGHVAIVDAVNGNEVEISEMNGYLGPYRVDQRWTSYTDFSYIY